MDSVEDTFVRHVKRGEAALAHISEKPWSDYTDSDYTIEQWHAACLIHQHQGAPTSKGQCKLPVKTPNGSVNRNGVHAAAAALAGARGGVNASDDEKKSAATSLIRLYHELDEKPPPSLLSHSDEDTIVHYGVKGMKWGVRRRSSSSGPTEVVIRATPGKRLVTKGGSGHPATEDATKAAAARQKARASSLDALSNAELQQAVTRMNLEQQYNRLSSQKKNAGAQFASNLLASIAKQQVTRLATDMAAKQVAETLKRSK